MDWLTENLILNIGGMGLAGVALFVIFFVIKKFAKAISEFNKILGNHLQHFTDMQERDIKSREEHAAKYTELVENIKNFFKK